MHQLLKKMFWFILRFFEQGEGPYNYKPLNRTVLLVVGLLFLSLSAITFYTSTHTEGYGYLIPLLAFFAVGFVCVIVATLGSDRAVAKIWGNR